LLLPLLGPPVLPGVVVVAPEPVVAVPPPTPLDLPSRVSRLAFSSAVSARELPVVAVSRSTVLEPVVAVEEPVLPGALVTGEVPCAFELSGCAPPVSTLRPWSVRFTTPEPVVAVEDPALELSVVAPVLGLVWGTVPWAFELSGRAPPVSTLRPCALGPVESVVALVCAKALNDTAATPQKIIGMNFLCIDYLL
jgi:hypothetical protein